MGKQSIKLPVEMESAEGYDFGTLLNPKDMSSGVFSSRIISQKKPRFTEFLSGECIFCKAEVAKEKAVGVNGGLSCGNCFQNLTETTFQVLKISNEKPRKVIRLFKCFGCCGNYSERRMSGCLAICRKCFRDWQSLDKRVRQRSIEKTLNKIGGFLRRRI